MVYSISYVLQDGSIVKCLEEKEKMKLKKAKCKEIQSDSSCKGSNRRFKETYEKKYV